MNYCILNEKNIFCINLESNGERWEKMEKRFQYFNMNVTRWNACTSKDIKDNFPDYLNEGQKGCSQSHINIWRHIVENKIEYALILEDDACFDKKWMNKIDNFFEKNEDKEWDAIFLNASEPIEQKECWVCTKDREQYLTAGYIISYKGSQLLLNDFRNCFFSSDWMTSRLQLYGHSFSYFPWLIIQEGKESNIGSNIEADHEKVVKCLNEINYSLDNYY